MRFGALVVAATLCCRAASASDDRDAPAAHHTRIAAPIGVLRGATRGDTDEFLGIPFAQPPLGPLRFAPPAALAEPAWPGEREASERREECSQRSPMTGFVSGDEDCLYLNVWTPSARRATTPLPVMVFLHGGSYMTGSGGKSLYDGRKLSAAGDVVVVTLNYRLGYLGFLAHPALSRTSGYGASGNYGFMDQIAALRWVQRNIAGFGGAPDRVTLFGESAGGGSVATLLVSPLAKGLFQQAIIESNGFRSRPLASQESDGQSVAARLGCGNEASDAATLACLRRMDPKTILAQEPDQEFLLLRGIGHAPTIDGHVLPADPLTLVASGAFAHVPLVAGNNANEMPQFLYRHVHDPASFRAAIAEQYGEAATDALVVAYPPADYDDRYAAAFAALRTDSHFVCLTEQLLDAVGAHQQEPVYRYHFTQRLVGLPAFHGVELPFVFQHLTFLTPSSTALAQTIGHAWTTFAWTGRPDLPVAGGWPTFTGAAASYVTLGTPLATGDHLRAAQCAVLAHANLIGN